jgi:hypothetical protein
MTTKGIDGCYAEATADYPVAGGSYVLVDGHCGDLHTLKTVGIEDMSPEQLKELEVTALDGLALKCRKCPRKAS